MGRTAHAITDHGNVSVHPLWEKSARAVGVKPIFGVEAYFTPSVAADREQKVRYNSHMTLLAETNAGYENMLHMVSESFRDGFYYRALIDEANVMRHRDGLIASSGCLSSMMSRILTAESLTHEARIERACALARRWETNLGKGNYFLEAQMFPLAATLTANMGILEVARRTGIKVIATTDVHMLDASQEQQDNRRMLHCVRDGKRWGDQSDEFNYADGYLMDEQQLRASAALSGLGERIDELAENVREVAARCNVTLAKSSFIEFPLPDGVTKRDYFTQLIMDGARRRGVDFAAQPEYLARVRYELSLIESKDYIDYFLVVSDLVSWAKDHGIFVGPARGSAAGSLICWLIRITEVNPLQFGLMFERFIDVTRTDLPDIDIDFDQERRKEVVHYMESRYGKERVGLLGTFTGWKGRNSLDAVGKIFSIPSARVEAVKGLLIERSSADSRMSFTIADTFAQWPQAEAIAKEHPDILKAGLLDGQMRGWSTHACGVVLSSRPLEEVCARYYRDGDTDGVTSVDYDGAGYLGLLKIDALGLKTLAVLRECAEAVGMSMDDVYNLPVAVSPTLPDDVNARIEATLDAFVKQDVQGIFQFEGVAMRSTLSQFYQKVDFMELAHINALSRPGPLHGGMTNAFIAIRNGVAERALIHPAVDGLLDYTHGQVVYQEQVMAIAQQVGHLSWDMVNQIRRAMSKRFGEEFFNRARGEFLDGAVNKSGMTEQAATDIWEAIVTFGAWAFNLSHSVSYTILSYWCMYFKTHHPTEFYAALCRREDDDERLRLYLLEFMRKGGRVLPPHFNLSRESWTVAGHMTLRAGFDSIKGIGDKVAATLVANQPYRDADDLKTRRVLQPTEKNPTRMMVVVNKAHIAALESVGAFSEEEGDADFLRLGAMVEALDACNPTHKIGRLGHADSIPRIVVSGTIKQRNQRSLNELYQSRNRVIDKETGAVTIRAAQAVKNPELDEFMNIHIEDDTGIILCQINRWMYPRFKSAIWEAKEGDIVMIMGTKDQGRLIIRAQDFKVAFHRQPDGSYKSVGALASVAVS